MTTIIYGIGVMAAISIVSLLITYFGDLLKTRSDRVQKTRRLEQEWRTLQKSGIKIHSEFLTLISIYDKAKNFHIG